MYTFYYKYGGINMQLYLLTMMIYFGCFILSFYALSCLKFEQFCHVRKPMKVQMLLLLLSIGLGYIVAQFLLAITIYNGL